MAQECPRSILGLPTRLPTRSSILLRLGNCLCRIPKVKRPSLLQPSLNFAPTSTHVFWLNSTNIAVLVISGICIVLVVTEIIVFTATRLHPLAYLILQLGKTITWFVLFTLAAMDTARDAAQGYSPSTSAIGYDLTTKLIENLVLL